MSRSTLWLKYLAELSVIAAIAVVIHAQQTGPGGVPGSGGGAVSSIFGRTGAVTAASGDYSVAQVTNAAATNAANTFSANQTLSSGKSLTLNGNTNFSVWSNVDANNNQALLFQASGGYYPLAIYGGSGNVTGIGIDGCYQWESNGYVAPLSGIGFICQDTSSTNYTFTLGTSYLATDGWLKLQAIGDGSSGNTDLRGHVTLVSGSGTYTFSKTYTVAPTCVASDTTTAAAVKVSTSTTTLTLTGTGTDTLNYICAN